MSYLEEWIKEENEHVLRMAKMQQEGIKEGRKFTILGIICISVPWIIDIVLVCLIPEMSFAIILCILSILATFPMVRGIKKVHRSAASTITTIQTDIERSIERRDNYKNELKEYRGY